MIDRDFFLACEAGDVELSKTLLMENSGIDVNCYHNEHDDTITALYSAAVNGRDAIVELLVAHLSIDVNKPEDLSKTTPLSAASANGHEKIARMLIDHPNIDVNQANIVGHTALHTALLAACSTIRVAESNEYCDSQVKIIEMLLAHPSINVNYTRPRSVNALSLAIYNNRPEIVKLLLEHPNIDLNVLDDHDKTPLWIASRIGHDIIVKMLLATKGPVDVGTMSYDEQATPGQIAFLKGHLAIELLLHNYELDPDKTRFACRAELKYNIQDAADVFGLLFFIENGFLVPCNETDAGVKRFFYIAHQLPMELKMLLCNAMFAVKKNFILDIFIQKAFNKWAQK
jgi:ankyrin repeat protein